MHSGAHRTTYKARTYTKKATVNAFRPTLTQRGEHKHGSCLEKKLLRKERDGNCTKATVIRTSVVPTAMKDTHRMTSLSTKRTRDEGSPSSVSLSSE